MKSARRKSADEPAAARSSSPRTLDPDETRAVMIAAAALVVFLYFIKLILLPFILPAVIAYISNPLLNWLARRTHWPRLLFAVLLFLLFLAAGSAVGYFAGTRVISEGRAMAGDLQDILQKFVAEAIGNKPVSLFGQPMDPQQIVQTLLLSFRNWFGQADMLALVAGYGVGAIMAVFLSVVLLFYFLASGERIAHGLLWIVPPQRRSLVKRIWTRLDPVLMRYFVGMILVVTYATAASYVGLALVLGIHHAVLLALMTGILETVPVIGSTSAAVLAGLVSLRTATGLMSILDYALYATALRFSIDQLVGPVVLGRAAHVHPVLIIFCFLSGGVVFGVAGVILAVPAALLVKSTLATLYGDDSD